MRTLLVEGDKTFKVEVPDDSSVTFGPWSPAKAGVGFDSGRVSTGTLRIYRSGRKDDVIACFSGVRSFRDVSAINYSEQVVKEEGATVWKNDSEGYVREDKISVKKEWDGEPVKALPPATPSKGGKKK